MNRNIDEIYALKGQNPSNTPARNFSANIPHLTSWIEDILCQTEKELHQAKAPATSFSHTQTQSAPSTNPSSTNPSSMPHSSSNPAFSNCPTTDDLVLALKRYDAIFKELLHITENFIPDIVKLFSKVWANVLKLMTFMIKSYHRYVKHTQNLQTETENLLTERQRNEASYNIKKEEYNLERTSLRATIRCQESELDILRNSQRLLEAENTKLRSTINEFLYSSESKDGLSAFLSLENNSSVQINEAEDSSLTFKSLNKLELILESILTSILKEHNRKNILFQDLLSFISNFLEKKKRGSIVYNSNSSVNNLVGAAAPHVGPGAVVASNSTSTITPVSASTNPSISSGPTGYSASFSLSRPNPSSTSFLATSSALGSFAIGSPLSNFHQNSLTSSSSPQAQTVAVPITPPVVQANASTQTIDSPKKPTKPLPPVDELLSESRLYSISKIIEQDKGNKNQLVFKPSTFASSPITTEKKVDIEYIIQNFFSYEKKRKNVVSVGVQVDAKEEHGLVLSLQTLKNISYSSSLLSATFDKKNNSNVLRPPEPVSIEEVSDLGIAPLPPLKITEEGSDFPYSIRCFMDTYPSIYRIPTIQWTEQTILAVYLDKIERLDDEFHTYVPLNASSVRLADANRLRYHQKKKKLSLTRNNNSTSVNNHTNQNENPNIKVYEDESTPELFNKYNPILPLTLNYIQSNDELSFHLVNYFLRVTGLQSVTDVNLVRLLKACEAHQSDSIRVQIFSSQLGLLHKEKKPNLDSRDTLFVLQVLKSLRLLGELKNDYDDIITHKSIKKQVQNPILEHTIKPEITRVAAIHTIKKIFSNWLPDEGDEYCVKVKAMIGHSDLGARFVDLDEYINLLLEPWQIVRKQWEDHARHLFHLYSDSYRVIGEACFSNDAGQIASDTICVLVDKDSVEDCLRRPLRLFMKEEEELSEEKTKVLLDNHKEPVVDLMPKHKFIQCIQLLMPSLDLNLIDAMYEEALEASHRQVLRKLGQIWKPYLDSNSSVLVSVSHKVRENQIQKDTHKDAHRKRPEDDQEYDEDHEDNYSATVVPMMPLGAQVSDRGRDGQSPGRTRTGSMGVSSSSSGLLSSNATSVSRVNGTNREFWVNWETSISQWVRPYHDRTFRSQDLEVDAFISTILRFDLIARSPLLEFVHMPPKDLWVNADIFHKQLLERKNRK